MTVIFKGDNPTKLYLDALLSIINNGKELSPRGKKVKELRPAVFEFTNPLNRVTFVKGRKVNPFFQLAEGLWILLGRADVKWLEFYNKNIKSFSDNEVYFNAPYGERMRFWGRNLASGEIFNPIDQLYDAYLKLKNDNNTRQAFVSIGDPRYDNYQYLKNGGLDIACNREFTFKIRDEKLDMTVFNRSNDIHWGLFGANLNQFSTIQEMMSCWLGLEVGTYSHITDSLHMYLEDYGWKETEKILKSEKYYYSPETVNDFKFKDEPRMSKLPPEDFDQLLQQCEYIVDNFIHDNEYFGSEFRVNAVIELVDSCEDLYFRMVLLAMFAYRCHKLGEKEGMIKALKLMPNCSWKISCLFFLYESYKEEKEYTDLFKNYPDDVKMYIQGL